MSDGDKLAMAVESLQQASAPPPPPPPNRAAAPPGKPKAPDLANISNRVRQPRAKLSLTRKLGSLVDSVNEILSEIPNEKKSVLRQEESDGGNITVPTTAFVGLVMKKFVELPTPRWQMYPSVHALEKSAAGMQQTTGGIGSVTYQDKEKERKGIKRVNMDPIVRLQDFGAGEFEELMAKCRQKMQECCKDSLHEDHLGPEEVEKEKGSSDNGTFTGAFIVALLRCFRDITLAKAFGAEEAQPAVSALVPPLLPTALPATAVPLQVPATGASGVIFPIAAPLPDPQSSAQASTSADAAHSAGQKRAQAFVCPSLDSMEKMQSRLSKKIKRDTRARDWQQVLEMEMQFGKSVLQHVNALMQASEDFRGNRARQRGAAEVLKIIAEDSLEVNSA